MRGTWAACAILAFVLAACSERGLGRGPTVSPPPAPSPTASAPPLASPTPSPSATPGAGALAAGAASISLSGDLTVTTALPTLAGGSIWSSPPAPMLVTWTGAGGRELELSGTSFLSRQPTSEDRTLAFVVPGADGPLEFRSSAGECDVTITPALPDLMGGVFSCSSLSDVDGGVTVDARGSFSATG
jgi:hypothetical protein